MDRDMDQERGNYVRQNRDHRERQSGDEKKTIAWASCSALSCWGIRVCAQRSNPEHLNLLIRRKMSSTALTEDSAVASDMSSHPLREIIHQEALPPTPRLLEDNNHLVIKPNPVPPLLPVAPKRPVTVPRLLLLFRRGGGARTTGGSSSADLDAPAAHAAGPALELPDAHLVAAAADADGFAAGRDLGVAYARGVAPEPDPR